jgi:hypothetical protein
LQWDISKAACDLQAHARWRSEFVPHGRILEVCCNNQPLDETVSMNVDVVSCCL